MTEQKHTETPWRAVEMGSEGARIFPDTRDKREMMKWIAIVGGRDTLTDFANGHFIVKCVNAHEELVAAAWGAVSLLESYVEDEDQDPIEMCAFADALAELRAALAKAEGTEPCKPSSRK